MGIRSAARQPESRTRFYGLLAAGLAVVCIAVHGTGPSERAGVTVWKSSSLDAVLDGVANAAPALRRVQGSSSGAAGQKTAGVEPAGGEADPAPPSSKAVGASDYAADQALPADFGRDSCEEDMALSEDTGEYLLIGVIPQQFVSAVLQGLRRHFRTAALLKRTAVLPSARFDEPGFRLQFKTVPYQGREPYYPLCSVIDYPTLMAPWSCLSTVTQDQWATQTTRVVDLYLIINASPTTKGCALESWMRDTLRKPMRNGTYVSGSTESKILDTLHGRVSVKDIKCISPQITTEALKDLIKGHSSVMISQPPFTFLKKGWDVCPGNKVSSLKVAKPWQVVGNSFIKEKLSRAPPGWRAPP
ncbi:hypothetical protein DIPPA_22487a, partial [Diplonema papillatum]